MNNQELVRRFANGEGAEGRAGNLSYANGVLWSYNMEIAWKRENCLLIEDVDGVSMTTSRHASLLRGYDGVKLPSETIRDNLGIETSDIVYGDHLWIGEPHAKYFAVRRLGKPQVYLMCVHVAAFEVPHYAQLPTRESHVWLRTLERPNTGHISRMWQFMTQNPTGKRPQARLKKAFREDRLAQCGTVLIEQMPGAGIPKKHLSGATDTSGITHHPPVGGAIKVTNYDVRDPTRFIGTINSRRETPKGMVCKLHFGTAPLLDISRDCLPVWEQNMAVLGRLE
jgi:hypothetical protein